MSPRKLLRVLLRVTVASLLCCTLALALLAISPGSLARLGHEGCTRNSGLAGLLEGLTSCNLPLDRSWLDGRPLLESVPPALALSASRVFPALLLLILLARALALSELRSAGRLRRALSLASTLPLFLIGYLAIILINRGVTSLLPYDARPGWFALPIGDGQPHIFRWGLEVLVLTIGDGALALGLRRLRVQVKDISERPYTLAAEANSFGFGGAARVLRRHLRAPTARLAVALLPLLFGSLIVLECLFQEPGAGQLLVDRLEARDLPVVAAILLAGVGTMAAATALSQMVGESA